MSKGIVYILTNPCLDGWVKIGMTNKNDISDRLKELNSPSNLPLSFRCYATYEVDDALNVEQNIHSLIDKVDDSLHARETMTNGRIREREFFRISPETAYGIFKNVANLRGDINSLKLYEPTEEDSEEEDFSSVRSRKANNSFKLLNISIGSELTFMPNESIKVTVYDDKNTVEYGGQQYAISALSNKLLVEKQGWAHNTHSNGWLYFLKDGITLAELRERMETDLSNQ